MVSSIKEQDEEPALFLSFEDDGKKFIPGSKIFYKDVNICTHTLLFCVSNAFGSEANYAFTSY